MDSQLSEYETNMVRESESDVLDLRSDVAGAVLAGGRGERMGRVVKGRLRLGGQSIMERLLSVYRSLFREIVISTRDAGLWEGLGLPLALDLLPGRSSLTGIHGALSAARASHVFVSACDAPFLQAGLVRVLLRHVGPEADVVVPLKADGFMEPLCAVYSLRCLGPIETQLRRGSFKIIEFFDQVRVVQVPETELRAGDPDLRSFINVNTPAELRAALLFARADVARLA